MEDKTTNTDAVAVKKDSGGWILRDLEEEEPLNLNWTVSGNGRQGISWKGKERGKSLSKRCLQLRMVN